MGPESSAPMTPPTSMLTSEITIEPRIAEKSESMAMPAWKMLRESQLASSSTNALTTR